MKVVNEIGWRIIIKSRRSHLLKIEKKNRSEKSQSHSFFPSKSFFHVHCNSVNDTFEPSGDEIPWILAVNEYSLQTVPDI